MAHQYLNRQYLIEDPSGLNTTGVKATIRVHCPMRISRFGIVNHEDTAGETLTAGVLRLRLRNSTTTSATSQRIDGSVTSSPAIAPNSQRSVAVNAEASPGQIVEFDVQTAYGNDRANARVFLEYEPLGFNQ